MIIKPNTEKINFLVDSIEERCRINTNAAWAQVQELHEATETSQGASIAKTSKVFSLTPRHLAAATRFGHQIGPRKFFELLEYKKLSDDFGQFMIMDPTDRQSFYGLSRFLDPESKTLFAFITQSWSLQMDRLRAIALAVTLRSNWRESTEIFWNGRSGFLVRNQSLVKRALVNILKAKVGRSRVRPIDFGIVATAPVFANFARSTDYARAVIVPKSGDISKLGLWHEANLQIAPSRLSMLLFIKPGAKDRFAEWAAANPQIQTEVVDLNDQ